MGAERRFGSLFRNRMEHMYFGQKIGLYFVFLRHFSKWLLLPAIGGLVIQTAHAIVPEYEGSLYLINVLFLSIWAPLWLANWRKMLLRKTLQRGKPLYVNIPYEEPVRMQFKGVERRSPITGEDGEKFFSPWGKLFRILCSSAFSFFMFIIVLALVVVITAA